MQKKYELTLIEGEPMVVDGEPITLEGEGCVGFAITSGRMEYPFYSAIAYNPELQGEYYSQALGRVMATFFEQEMEACA